MGTDFRRQILTSKVGPRTERVRRVVGASKSEWSNEGISGETSSLVYDIRASPNPAVYGSVDQHGGNKSNTVNRASYLFSKVITPMSRK